MKYLWLWIRTELDAEGYDFLDFNVEGIAEDLIAGKDFWTSASEREWSMA